MAALANAGGRPRKEIDIEELAHFCDLGYTRARLAEHFAMSVGTIGNLLRRHHIGKSNRRTNISGKYEIIIGLG